MNLNGRKYTKTVLNGRPLVSYDLTKVMRSVHHERLHQKTILKSRNTKYLKQSEPLPNYSNQGTPYSNLCDVADAIPNFRRMITRCYTVIKAIFFILILLFLIL